MDRQYDFAALEALLKKRSFKALREALLELNEVDIAEFLGLLNGEEAVLAFRTLPKGVAADVFAELEPEMQQLIVAAATDAELAVIVEDLYVDDAVDMLEDMPANVVKRILKNATPEMRGLINQFLKYPEHSAGSIMTAEFTDLRPTMTVEQAIEHIRRTGEDRETVYTCYVVGPRRRLLGVVTVRSLLLARDSQLVSDVMEDGVIRGVYDRLPLEYATAPLVDYGQALVMQSFADMHLHAPQYPMLGMGMDLPLLEWLDTYTFPTEARFADTDYARRIYRRLATDLITNGTTRVCMFSSLHTDATWILMEELERAGVTGYVGKVNMDRNGLPGILQETTEESIRETLRWLEGCHFDHVKPILTPRFTPSCTDELMEALGRLAQEKGLYVQSHLSENLGEIQWVKELHPDCQQYWETYDKYGLWKEHTIMAHCVHSDRRECDAMRRAGVVVAHCAGSNINLCSGVSPVREMLQQGIWVTLGSDIAGGACLPMYKVATMSIRASKIKRIETDWSEDFLTVPEAYYLATSSGHRYFGDRDGFAHGNRLHAIVVDDGDFTEASHPLTVRERFERAIYMLHRHNITAVWSDGRCVVGQMLQ